MIAIAHFNAISFYLGAAALAAAPFARPVNSPVRTVAGAKPVTVISVPLQSGQRFGTARRDE